MGRLWFRSEQNDMNPFALCLCLGGYSGNFYPIRLFDVQFRMVDLGEGVRRIVQVEFIPLLSEVP